MEKEVNNNNENKKKRKILLLIGLVTLLVAVLGATYAYFQISTETNSSNTTITGKTPDKSLVTLKDVTSNLHLNISASDMSLANANNEYYATDAVEKSYETNESDGTKTIAEVQLTGGEETTQYSCTAKLTVSKVTEEENTDTMIDVLHSGDMFLQFKGNIISNILDLSMLKETGKIEYNLRFKVTGSTKEVIQAYIKLINKETQQNYLSGKKLNIDIDTSDLKCNVFIPDPKIAELREKDSQGYLSEDLQGGMYRYQASFPECNNESECENATQMTNWIVFGTDKNCEKDGEDKCTNIENMTYDDYIDKYMYRIIGITEEGQLYLLKETFLKEESATSFKWNTKYSLPDCLGEACEWPNADIYKRLNGETSNGNPIFVNSSEYEYMTDGTQWYNLIEGHNWMYGDTIAGYSTTDAYTGDTVYDIEMGKATTTRWWPDEGTQSICSSNSLCTEKDYTWSKSILAKIGLMYDYDVDYAYPGGNPGNKDNIKNSWIHFQKDGYNISPTYEWLMARFGVRSTSDTYVPARGMDYTGYLNYHTLNLEYGMRSAFYLSSKAKIASGDGTKENPYVLEIKKNN